MRSSKHNKKCYLCKEKESEKFGQLWKCHNCELGQSIYKFNKKIYNKKYLSNYVDRGATRIGDKLNLLRLGLIAPYLSEKRDSNLLDYGCGPGTFISFAFPHLKICDGVDINPNIERQNVYSKIPKDVKYDIVTMFDVIEHFGNPIRTLKTIAKSIKIGGHIIITTPNFQMFDDAKWRHYKPKEHLFYYEMSSLTMLLETCGFERVEMGYRESLIRKGYYGYNILHMVGRKEG